MKLFINLFLFLFTSVIFANKSFSLTDFRINSICKKKIEKASCIKILKEKRFNIKNGNLIEIPVIPYKEKS